MTRSAHRSPPPSAPRKYDAVLDDERSHVRVRLSPSRRPPQGAAEPEEAHVSGQPTMRCSTPEPAAVSDQLARKLRFARVVLQLLQADDPRAGLLSQAVLHRDERLLDRMLEVLGDDDLSSDIDMELAAASAAAELRETSLDVPIEVDLSAIEDDAGSDRHAIYDLSAPFDAEEENGPDTERESVPPMTLRPNELTRRNIGTLLPPAHTPRDDDPE